jgi:hypothetical protein
VDWFNLLGAKNQLALELALNAVILNTIEVTKIVASALVLDSSTREITFTYTVETIYSNATSEGTISSTTTIILTEAGDTITTEDGDALSGG